VRGYLFATARSALGEFWTRRFALPQAAQIDDRITAFNSSDAEVRNEAAGERLNRIMSNLPSRYAQVLELRFLRGYSLNEVATEMGTSVGNVKILQLRWLRAAGRQVAEVDIAAEALGGG